jgi:hypothetical protein
VSDVFEKTSRYEEPAGLDAPAEQASPPNPKGRVLKQVLKGIGGTLLVLVVLVVLLYNFGSMQSPSSEVRQAYAAGVATGKVPAIGQSFHIPIPGCVCHSPDPVLQMQHESRHVKDCAGCHSR